MTKKYTRLYRLFLIMSVLFNIGPLVGYSIAALVQAEFVHQKVALCMTVMIVLIMSAICLVNKIALKSRLWIVLIGLYVCLHSIIDALILIAACQVIDELLLTPLKKHYKEKATINKEIDRRLG